jgi:hypothetical protein
VTLIEPGGFRTDWAGSSMSVHDIREEYQPSVGQLPDENEVRQGCTNPERHQEEGENGS